MDGWQTELPDVWLPGGEVWLTQRTDKSLYWSNLNGWVREEWSEQGLKVTYGGYKEVEAVAYDMMISGKNSEAVSVLRLWRARNVSRFDMKLFSQGDYLRCMQDENEAEVISKVLYPADNHYEGKSLRLKQQYFLVSASLQNIINDHKHRYRALESIARNGGDPYQRHAPRACDPRIDAYPHGRKRLYMGRRLGDHDRHVRLY